MSIASPRPLDSRAPEAIRPGSHERPWRILCVGDSITQGGILGREEWTYRWPLFGLLKDSGVEFRFIGTRSSGFHLHAQWPAYKGHAFDPAHEGYYGAKTALVSAYVRENLAALPPPDVALIHLGTNDQQPDCYEFSIIEPLEVLIRALRNENAAVKVLVGHLNFQNGPALRIRPLVEDMAIRLSTETSPVITVHHYEGWVADPVNPASHTFDWVHPNPQGQEKMARAWWAALSPLLSTQS